MSVKMTRARVLARKLAAQYAEQRAHTTVSRERLAAAYMAGYDRARMERPS